MHSGRQFHRHTDGVEMGFWASLADWVAEIVLCGIAQRHDWDDWPACRRCGVSDR